MVRPPGHVTEYPAMSHHEEAVNKTSPVTKNHRKEAQVRGARSPHQLTNHQQKTCQQHRRQALCSARRDHFPTLPFRVGPPPNATDPPRQVLIHSPRGQKALPLHQNLLGTPSPHWQFSGCPSRGHKGPFGLCLHHQLRTHLDLGRNSTSGACKGDSRMPQSKPDSAHGPRRRRDTWWPQKRRTRGGGAAKVEAQGWPGTVRAGAA